MKKSGKIALVLVSLALCSCFTSGHDFPSETVWIKKETTAQKDVQMVLGTPFAVGSSGGVTTWTYAFYKYQLFGKSYYKELKFYWTPGSLVKHFVFSSSFPADLPAGLGDDGQAASPSSDTRDAKKPNDSAPRKAYPSY